MSEEVISFQLTCMNHRSTMIRTNPLAALVTVMPFPITPGVRVIDNSIAALNGVLFITVMEVVRGWETSPVESKATPGVGAK